MPDGQILFNILVGVCGVCGGWILNSFNQDIRDLRTTDEALRAQDSVLLNQVNALNVLVAGGYVKREEMERTVDKLGDAIFEKLNIIDQKLDSKVDK